MPNRTLSGELTRSRSLSKVSIEAELTFLHLVSVADDWGRFDGRLGVLHAALYPTRDDVPREALASWLGELEGVGLFVRYCVDGEPYLYLPEWFKYQRNRPDSKAKFPDPEKADKAAPRLAATRRDSPQPAASSVSVSDSVPEEEEEQKPSASGEAEPSPHVPHRLSRLLGDLPGTPEEKLAWTIKHGPEIEEEARFVGGRNAEKFRRELARIMRTRWNARLNGSSPHPKDRAEQKSRRIAETAARVARERELRGQPP